MAEGRGRGEGGGEGGREEGGGGRREDEPEVQVGADVSSQEIRPSDGVDGEGKEGGEGRGGGGGGRGGFRRALFRGVDLRRRYITPLQCRP